MKAVVESQLQAQFLRGQGAGAQADTELIERKFRIYGLGTPPEFQKFVCGKKLYNYDSLEPSERKLVL